MTSSITLAYDGISDDTDKAQSRLGIQAYRLRIDAGQLWLLSNDDNLRPYVGDANQRRGPSHKAIAATIVNEPDAFSSLNGGLSVRARDCEIDKRRRQITLYDASIVDGGQTQGEISAYLKACEARGQDPNEVSVKLNLIITDDDNFAKKITVAHNTRLQVKEISKMGILGKFDEIDAALRDFYRNSVTPFHLAKKGVVSDDFAVQVESYLQTAFALLPQEELAPGESFGRFKAGIYHAKSAVLRRYERLLETRDTDPVAARQFAFIRDFGPQAHKIATQWREHSGWRGEYLREGCGLIKRKNPSDKPAVVDGLLMPVLASLSHFVSQQPNGQWRFSIAPSDAKPIIAEVAKLYRDHARKDIGKLAKNASSYELLLTRAVALKASRHPLRFANKNERVTSAA
jgi:hypothetical protein